MTFEVGEIPTFIWGCAAVLSGSIALKADSSAQGVLLGIILEILLLVFSTCHVHEAGDRYLS